MPYIKSNDGRREKLQKGDTALTAGELNYQIFYYVKHSKEADDLPIALFVKQFLGINPNYQKYNDMTGALVRCAKEIDRRLAVGKEHYLQKDLYDILDSFDDEIAAYEEIKIIENGDV